MKSGSVESTLTRNEFEDMVRAGIRQCREGEVFQVVYSRHFQQGFTGDDFQVYRALRSINPSPFLYYLDDGDRRLFGSSPEAQLLVRDGVAEVHPIAGTVKRTENAEENDIAIAELRGSEKENAEHTMLLDLARNDLNRSGHPSHVSRFKEVQLFSHVIHLVSHVQARLRDGVHAARVFADTFPAGTLSGAPKLRAIELIAEHEPHSRGLYGGAVGCYGLNGDCIHAIVIRSFVSRGGSLHYQAGAGVVMDSIPEAEAEEVERKLHALAKAMDLAETL
jgi:anthranilate synthase component 1